MATFWLFLYLQYSSPSCEASSLWPSGRRLPFVPSLFSSELMNTTRLWRMSYARWASPMWASWKHQNFIWETFGDVLWVSTVQLCVRFWRSCVLSSPQSRMLFVLNQSKFLGYFWAELLAGLRDVSNRVLWRNPSDTFGERKVPETVAGRFWNWILFSTYSCCWGYYLSLLF